MHNILIVTAVPIEADAVARGLSSDPRFTVIAAGVGPAAAAAATATALAQSRYSLAISAGIGGGFAAVAPVGSLVLADELVAADLGVRTAEGYLSVDELGFGTSRITADAGLTAALAAALADNGLACGLGPVLTVSTATGTAEAAAKLAGRVPGAAAEAMEGFGVATAAAATGVPVLELRAISNAVGPRDRASWRIPEALAALEAAGPALLRLPALLQSTTITD